MRASFIPLAGLALVAGDDAICQLPDLGLGFYQLQIAHVAECLTTNVTVDDWASCLADQEQVSEVCADYFAERVADGASVCSTPCVTINSTACRICNGVVALQEISYLVPNTSYTPCGSDYDRESIMNASWSDVVEAGNITDLFFTVATLSDSCDYCLHDRMQRFITNCGDACTDPQSADCLNCRNVYMVVILSSCSSWIWEGICEDSDFVSIEAMDPATVKDCIEGVENGDGLVHCLTDGGESVNLTEGCALTITGHFGYNQSYNCNESCIDDTTVECYNCKGSVIAQETFAFIDSANVNGSCGSDADLTLISDVYNDTLKEGLLTCNSGSGPYAGAMCIGLAAGVSNGCSRCLVSRTHHVRQQCARHCHHARSVDCLECVNIGMMAVAAHCNDHMSDSMGMTGLSLISLSAILSLIISV